MVAVAGKRSASSVDSVVEPVVCTERPLKKAKTCLASTEKNMAVMSLLMLGEKHPKSLLRKPQEGMSMSRPPASSILISTFQEKPVTVSDDEATLGSKSASSTPACSPALPPVQKALRFPGFLKLPAAAVSATVPKGLPVGKPLAAPPSLPPSAHIHSLKPLNMKMA